MGQSHVRQLAPRHMDGIVYQHSHRFESQVIGKGLIDGKGLIGVTVTVLARS